MGGGTYAKDFPNCVAFGGAFNDEVLLMHSEDEKVEFQKLLDSIPIYAEAILRINNED
jgi:succinyl-diaminopimelate desuccinylase